jgi:hypothetical protein
VTGDELRQMAMALPEVTEKLTWESDITFRVHNKMFIVMGLDGGSASIKATLEAQQALVSSEPETYRVSAYVGRYGWTTVQLDRVEPEDVRDLVEDAWRLTAAKKLVARFDASHGTSPPLSGEGDRVRG